MEVFSSQCNDDIVSNSDESRSLQPLQLYPCFQGVAFSDHHNRWRNSNSKVVGFLLHEHFGMFHRWPPAIQLLQTTNLGRNIEAKRGSMLGGGIKFFISKSPKGGLLLFGAVDPKRFYVCKPISNDPPLEIPPPPAHYERCLANILSDDNDGEAFKVILVWNLGFDDDTTRVGIQTYYSLSGKWEQQSALTCSTPFSLFPSVAQGGIVNWGGSVLYWAAVRNKKWCLAAWNMGNGNGISLIYEPEPVVTLTVKYDTCYLCCTGTAASLEFPIRDVMGTESGHGYGLETSLLLQLILEIKQFN